MKKFETVGIVGAGNMGSGIGQKYATEGFQVVLVDLDEAAVTRGMERLRTTLGEGVARRIFSQDQADGILGRITATHDLGGLSDCDLVIEAIFEDKAVKKDLFSRLGEVVRPDCLVATNTSSFQVTDLAEAISQPERFLGLHYFYHPAKNRLVEVVKGKHTSQEAFDQAWRIQELVGKTPIACADAPGFVVNRYFVPWINEAVRLLEEGAADLPSIEQAAKAAFGVGMGPFELMNVTGIPIALHAATTLGEDLGAFYAPSPLLAKQKASGELFDFSGEADPAKADAVSNRLRAATFLIASQMVDDGVCSREDCDIGARVGLRWPKGPFELINDLGVDEAHRLATDLATRWDLPVPAGLSQQAEQGEPFALQLVTLKVDAGIASVCINRPDALNALNPVVVAQLAEQFDAAASRDDVHTIVLAGSGKAFVAGADVKFFVDRIDANAVSDIDGFTRTGQELFARIDGCSKKVVCKLDGLSLGGGSELALCADLIVATDSGSMGFPETGIGIYPGLGGTQRTSRRAGAAIARHLVGTGETVTAATAWTLGLVDEVVDAAEIDARIRELAGGAAPAPRPERHERWQRIETFYASAKLHELADRDGVEDPVLAKAVKRLGQKAPVALAIAERCIATGETEGIDAGLEAELAGLAEIFATADAYEGLTSLLAGKRPSFTGS